MRRMAAVIVAALLFAGAAGATTGASGDKEAQAKQAGYWTVYVLETTSGSFTIEIYVNGVLWVSDTDFTAVSYDVWLDEGDVIEAYLTSVTGDFDLRLEDPYGTVVDGSYSLPTDEPDYVYGYASGSSSSSSRTCGAAPEALGFLWAAPLGAVLFLLARRRAARATV